jgi:flagellar hook-length control protein FliK
MALAVIPFRLTVLSPHTMFRTGCRKPHAILGKVILPAFQGFSHCSDHSVWAAEFAVPAAPARLFMLLPEPAPSKNSAKSRTCNWPGPCVWSSEQKFFADHQRKICVRASTASQTVSPANIPSSQAKADAHKADAASPFSILVEATTAKDTAKAAKKDAKDSGEKIADEKAPIRRNDTGQKENKLNDRKRDEGKRDVSPAQAAPLPKQAAAAKAAKRGEDKDGAPAETDKAQTDKDVADTKQVAAAEQLPDQQFVPSAPVAQASIAAPVSPNAEDDQDDMAIDAAAAKTPAPSPNMPSSGRYMPQSDTANATGKAAIDAAPPQTQLAAQTDDTDDVESTEPVIAQSAATPAADAKPVVAAKDTAKPVAARATAKIDAPDTSKSAANVEAAQDKPARADTDGDDAVRDVQAKSAKTEIAQDITKDDGAFAPKGHAAHDNVAAKTDAGAPDSQKPDASQADARPVAADTAATSAAAKTAPQSVAMSNATFAINTIAAPQAAQHAQAPVTTQHVQVTAQPAPNLPALAVEISAKSQSGAKQFDIRLDPPELGRVDVRLSIDATGKASAHLSADQPQTLSLLQKDAPLLTRALREAGLDVSQDGLNFSLRQQAHDQNGHDGNNGRFGGARAFSLAATASIDPIANSFAYRGVADGRVDIRV